MMNAVDVMRVRAGTGDSGLQDAYEAGKQAATAAVTELGGEKPSLVLVFTMPHYDLSLKRIQA